ncbi:CPBP family intramembrane glutamic endopeptidase [Nocardioides sp. zg-1230]|uniref:CPBP family intramembrane glutamic endopeptidase n=1 Tax=Nocardioides sp. zg-1230 TaxID=2736601 RepID=UPI0015574AD6|nr:type II CAAX endopeptidase family protein [Nocardioides sp. zg-1230]NPC45114.1 CPBP family intramembrane metalloprotease [Nocardioides sp. zg-1230]
MTHPPTTNPSERARTDVPAARTGRWLRAHPVLGYVLLAYVLSWPAWVLAYVTGSFALVVLGGFGPAGAAAVMLRLAGQPLGPWLRGLLTWRVRPRFYAYALALPAAVYGLVNLTLQVLGTDVDWSLLPGRVPGYLLTLVLTATLFGGLEEPGWRGYALPRLQARHTPLAATALVGLAWGVWHVPLYGPAGFVVPLVLAFFYTWLFNRTGSVLLCVLLHASFTAAQDHLLFTADSLTVDAVILGIYLACAAAVVALTKARLGAPPDPTGGR